MDIPNANCEVTTCDGGAEVTIAAMNEYRYIEMGRKTFTFVHRVMRNPKYRKLVEDRLAQKRAAGLI